MGQSKLLIGVFDQEQIDFLSKVLDRGWDIVSHTDSNPNQGARETLALCVIAEMRTGDENFVELVNRSVAQFRAMRVHEIVRKRRLAEALPADAANEVIDIIRQPAPAEPRIP